MIAKLSGGAPRSVHVDGTPIVAATGRVLDSAALQAIAPDDRDAWIALAKSLRGQFAIVASESDCATAVTDLTGCYPVFRLSGAGGNSSMLATSLAELEPHSTRSVRRSALYQYVAFAAMDLNGETIYTDVDRAPAGSVTCYRGRRAESHEYGDWERMAGDSESDIDAAEKRLESIVESYTEANLHAEVLGILLSGGTDSALLTALLREKFKGRLQCFTQNFLFSRYSELTQARENARTLGVETTPVMLDRASHLEAVLAVNSRLQDQPCFTMQAFNLWSLIHSVAPRCRKFMLGEHADSLFLGFGHFFEGLPVDMDAYMSVTGAMSAGQKLAWIAPRATVAEHDAELLSVLGLRQQEYLDWLEEFARRRKARLAPFAGHHLTTLQQLNGQIDGGLSWQRIVLPVMRSMTQVGILTPFFDVATIALALSLPVDWKYRDGKTKFFLRYVLKKHIGSEMRKQPAAASPVAIWRLLPSIRERAAVSASLRPYYDRLVRGNVMTRGRLVNHCVKVAALGIWMGARGL